MTVNLDATQLQSRIMDLATPAAQSASATRADHLEKFQAMMENQSMMPPVDSASQSMTVASKLIEAQDAELQNTITDMQNFSHQAPTLSLGEIAGGTMKLMVELSSAQLDMQGKMGVVESSKSAVETLMKNQ